MTNKIFLVTLFAFFILFIHSCIEDEALKDKKENDGNDILSSLSYSENDLVVLPVVFHCFYTDNTPEENKITYNRAKYLIDECNKIYSGTASNNSVDMRVKFVLAEYDDAGKRLTQPGVNMIKVKTNAFDYSNFMESKDNLKYIWNVDKYINIALFEFINSDKTKSTTMGASHTPYITKPHSLKGLQQLDFFPNHSNLTYTHCICINSLFLASGRSIENEEYYIHDTSTTLAHELGHYLGLFHSFNEKEEGKELVLTEECIDSDYCADTPAYNRIKYLEDARRFIDSLPKNRQIGLNDVANLFVRLDCKTNKYSTPNNVMDYEYSFQSRFTTEQKKRVRYVVSYSPFIPRKQTRVANYDSDIVGEVEFPVRISTCKCDCLRK